MNRYADIIFFDNYEDESELNQLMENREFEKACHYMEQWDYGEDCDVIENEPLKSIIGNFSDYEVFGDYIIYFSFGLGSCGLLRKIKEE